MRFATLSVLALLFGSTARAQQRQTIDFNFEEPPDGFGIGFILGAPSGLSLAWRNGERDAVQAHFGWSVPYDYFHISVDYIRNLVVFESPETSGVVWPLYLGIGGKLSNGGSWRHRYYHDTGLGLRVPFGISMLPRRVSIDAFLEVVPVIYVYPTVYVGLDGGIGARLYF